MHRFITTQAPPTQMRPRTPGRRWALSMLLLLALSLAACARGAGRSQSGAGDPVLDAARARAGSLAAVQFYVTNHLSNTVSVVDIPTGQTVAEIPVGVEPTEVTISSDLARAYVSHHADGTVAIVDTRQLTVLKTIKVGSHPHAMALTADDQYLFVPDLEDGTVSVIDTEAAVVIKTIALAPGAQATQARFSPAGDALYVLSRGTDTITVLDAATHEVQRTFSVGSGSEPQRFVFSADGARVYVSQKAQDQVAIFTVADGQSTGAVSVGQGPTGLALSPNGRWLVVSNTGGGSVSVIDSGSNTVVKTIEPFAFPEQVIFNRQGSRFYTVSAGDNQLVPVRTEFWEVEEGIPVGAQPHDVEIKAPKSGGSCG